jgi:hypothetical protein
MGSMIVEMDARMAAYEDFEVGVHTQINQRHGSSMKTNTTL